jgi:hypothetical protein
MTRETPWRPCEAPRAAPTCPTGCGSSEGAPRGSRSSSTREPARSLPPPLRLSPALAGTRLFALLCTVEPLSGERSAVEWILDAVTDDVRGGWPDCPRLLRDKPVAYPASRFGGLSYRLEAVPGGTWDGEIVFRSVHPAMAGVPITTHVTIEERANFTRLGVRVTADGGIDAARNHIGAGQAQPAFLRALRGRVAPTWMGAPSSRAPSQGRCRDFVQSVLEDPARAHPVVVLSPREEGGFASTGRARVGAPGPRPASRDRASPGDLRPERRGRRSHHVVLSEGPLDATSRGGPVTTIRMTIRCCWGPGSTIRSCARCGWAKSACGSRSARRCPRSWLRWRRSRRRRRPVRPRTGRERLLPRGGRGGERDRRFGGQFPGRMPRRSDAEARSPSGRKPRGADAGVPAQTAAPAPERPAPVDFSPALHDLTRRSPRSRDSCASSWPATGSSPARSSGSGRSRPCARRARTPLSGAWGASRTCSRGTSPSPDGAGTVDGDREADADPTPAPRRGPTDPRRRRRRCGRGARRCAGDARVGSKGRRGKPVRGSRPGPGRARCHGAGGAQASRRGTRYLAQGGLRRPRHRLPAAIAQSTSARLRQQYAFMTPDGVAFEGEEHIVLGGTYNPGAASGSTSRRACRARPAS